tara:strand:+ start:150 stop:734 length:585 start_codon:yes stop_codon:yes gene_type:complete
MFNGIISKTGEITQITKRNNNCTISVKSKLKLNKNDIGSSVCCSGACLTVDKIKNNNINFYLSKETLRRTIFNFLKKGDIINLEKPLKYSERISGHFVQGHVDTTGHVEKIQKIGKSWLINFKILRKYKKFTVTKGSITINGVSLTIAKVTQKGFQIAIIPKTLYLTNLIYLKKNDLVNIEFDILAKYIKKLII